MVIIQNLYCYIFLFHGCCRDFSIIRCDIQVRLLNVLYVYCKNSTEDVTACVLTAESVCQVSLGHTSQVHILVCGLRPIQCFPKGYWASCSIIGQAMVTLKNVLG